MKIKRHIENKFTEILIRKRWNKKDVNCLIKNIRGEIEDSIRNEEKQKFRVMLRTHKIDGTHLDLVFVNMKKMINQTCKALEEKMEGC